MPRDREVCESSKTIDVVSRRKELKRSDADVAGCDTRDDGARAWCLAVDDFAGGHDGEASGRRDAERMHGLAHDVLAKGRSERASPVSAARESRTAGPFELDVKALTARVDELAQEVGASVAKLRHEVPELMAGVGEGDGARPGNQRVPREILRAPVGVA